MLFSCVVLHLFSINTPPPHSRHIGSPAKEQSRRRPCAVQGFWQKRTHGGCLEQHSTTNVMWDTTLGTMFVYFENTNSYSLQFQWLIRL